MQKIACVFSFQESSWVSCQKIVLNLHKAYDTVPGLEIRNFHYGIDSQSADLLELTNGILEMKPDTIIVLDHKPHPLYFMRLLLPYFEGEKKPRIIFHVFGDFTLYYKEWTKLGLLLKGFPVTFIVASERQKLLIDKFLTPHHECLIVPFPVEPKEFYYNPEDRIRQRKEWGVGDDDVIFTFTGRISRQKRTHMLLPIFHEVLQQEKTRNAHLYIYGLPDHIGDNFLNVWDNENEYFRKVDRIYKELPPETQARIHFMGSVANKELRSVYAGADYLVNISVHNDEDFGMSVAEAQMTGLPSILTDWGGLASFYHPELPEATRYLEVKLGKYQKLISKKKTVETICEAIRNPARVDREKLIQLASKRFSVEASGDKLKKILQSEVEKFISFSDFHTLITNRMNLHKPVFLTKYQTIHPIFRKLYSAYVRNS